MCANACGHYLYLKRVSDNITNFNPFPKTPSVHFPKSCFLFSPVTSVLTFPLHMSKYTSDQKSGPLKKKEDIFLYNPLWCLYNINLKNWYPCNSLLRKYLLLHPQYVNILSTTRCTSRTGRNRRFNKQSLDLWGTQRGRSTSWLLPPKAENILALKKGCFFFKRFSTFGGHPEATYKNRIFWVPIPILRIGR